MCNHPACGASEDPLPINEETLPMMRLECTSAALHCITCYSKGWVASAHALFEDQGRKWGFEGITRMAWVLCTACAILPTPDDAPSVLIDPSAVQSANGDPVPPEIVARITLISDQVQAAFTELVDLTRAGATEDAFADRFHTITDQEDMLRPLVAGLLAKAEFVFVTAQSNGEVSALDQFQAAIKADLDLEDRDDTLDHLKALYDLPDAQDR